MTPEQERQAIATLIRRIVDECPRRRATSASELRAQQIVRERLHAQGLQSHTQHFRFNDSIHANFVLHFGLGTLGTLVSGVAPRLAFVMHAAAAGSYWADSTRRAYLLRRLLGFKWSQNVIATLPARREPKLRIVFVAHADAAFTGLVFHPRFVKRFLRHNSRGLLAHPIELAVKCQAALAAIDVLRATMGPIAFPLRPLEALLTIPGLAIFLLNLEVLVRNQMVPGANDDLTGVASLPVIAQRIAADPHPDVEYVFVASGAEEASLGGADALAREMRDRWDPSRTVVIALDTLSLGDLHFVSVEGEVTRYPIPAWLRDAVVETAAEDPRFSGIQELRLGVGATDACAFLAHGWDAVALTCIDPALGTAHHYHRPEDTPESLDLDRVMDAIDFTELLTRRIVRQRLVDASSRP